MDEAGRNFGDVTARELFVDPPRFWAGEVPHDGPLALIDLDAATGFSDPPLLPPCPVIGTGNPEHPFARWCDAVVEAPFSIDAIVRNVQENPRTAAIVVQLLRFVPGLGPVAALDAESFAYGVLQAGAEHARWLAAQPRRDPAAGGCVLLERNGDHLVLTLDREAAGNAIDREMRDALHDGLMLGAADKQIARILLRAKGRSFSLGADLAEFGTTRDPVEAHAIRRLTLPARAAALCADRIEAHVQGACVGAGLELAAWAGRFTAAPGAWFHLPELAMGVLPGAGGCVSLSRRIGRQRTALLILSGKRLSARQALSWGLVDAIVDDPPTDDGQADIV